MRTQRQKQRLFPFAEEADMSVFTESHFGKAASDQESARVPYSRHHELLRRDVKFILSAGLKIGLSCMFLLLSCCPKSILAEVQPSWTTPIAPFRIADNLYYVGGADLASYLVVTSKGNILINADFSGSPSLIRACVEKLGFHWSDTRILLNSQAHADHMGGAAEMVHETHAKNMVMDSDVSVVETGGRTDFLAPSPDILRYAPVHVDRVLHDGDTVTLGDVTLTAHKTAGHTRGCTTWTMRSHIPGEPAGTARNIVILGGVSFWSEYRFAATPDHPVSYPGIAQDFQHTFSELLALPCDVFLGAHGGYFDMLAKLKRYPQDGPRVFIDPAGYREFVADAQETFRKALSKQATAAAAH
jgi:metallo-beta-lactamase class B